MPKACFVEVRQKNKAKVRLKVLTNKILVECREDFTDLLGSSP